MRILRLDLRQSQATIDLHPFITVLRGLDDHQRDEVIEILRSMARGSTAGIEGLVQHRGLLVDLDGFGSDRSGPITAADIVIDGAVGPRDAAALLAQLDQVERRAEIDAVVVEEIRADLDPAARARVAAFESRLTPLDEAALARRTEEEELVAAALDAVQRHQPTIHEAPESVLALRHRWDEHHARRGEAEEHFATLMTAISEAEDRVTEARHELATAERDARPVMLTRDEEALLETLSFPELDESRRGRWRKTLRPEEAKTRDELLGKVGVDSWTAYTLYRAAPVAPSDRVETAEDAVRALETAEAKLARARTALAEDRLTTELNEEVEAIRADAREHLGQLLPSDLGRALHELVIEKPNPPWSEAVEALAALLDDLDVAPAPDAQFDAASATERGEAVVETARLWLEERRAELTDADQQRLRTELREARRDLGRHERALVRIGRAEAAAEASAARRRQLAEQLESRTDDDPGGAASVAAALQPVVDQIESEADGAVPVVIVEPFDRFDDGEVVDLMTELAELSDRVQFVVMTEHPAGAAWAEQVGLDQAFVSRPRARSAPGLCPGGSQR